MLAVYGPALVPTTDNDSMIVRVSTGNVIGHTLVVLAVVALSAVDDAALIVGRTSAVAAAADSDAFPIDADFVRSAEYTFAPRSRQDAGPAASNVERDAAAIDAIVIRITFHPRTPV